MSTLTHLDMLAQPPDSGSVHALLMRFKDVRPKVDVKNLAHDGDRMALAKLIDAARLIDPIYWRQRSALGWDLIQAIRCSPEHAGGELDRLVSVNYGPWDNLKGDVSFWGRAGQELPPGGGFYPPALTRGELEACIERHPGERAALMKPTTLIRRDQDRLVAVPYESEYAEDLQRIASCLKEASETVSDPAFGRYLVSRAAALLDGDLFADSDRRWIEASDSPIDFVIGPYEVYDDALHGVKTSYEAAVLVRHPLTSTLREFERHVRDLGRDFLPGAIAHDADRVRIGVFDVAFVAGMLNMGGKAIAVALPNDEEVRRDTGARLLLFRNVIEAKFDSILRPMAAMILPPEDLPLVNNDAFLLQTLLHETGHVMGSGFVQAAGQDTAVSVKSALSERYSTIEEARADLLGLHILTLLIKHGKIPAALQSAAATTFVISSMRAVRFGDRSDHARAAAISLSHLRNAGAIRREGDRLRIDARGAQQVLAELAVRVQTIASSGDYRAAGELIERFGSTPPDVGTLLTRASNVPVDLEFTFDAHSDSGAGDVFGRPVAATG